MDFLVAEALSALCRRSFERKGQGLQLDPIVEWIREQLRRGLIYFPALTADCFANALTIVRSFRGELNFNDARLVVMQRNGDITDVASFDGDFDAVEGFRRIS